MAPCYLQTNRVKRDPCAAYASLSVNHRDLHERVLRRATDL